MPPIPPGQAQQMINDHRNSHLQSVLLDQDIIDFIALNAVPMAINGLRVYLAQEPTGQKTVVVVPTTLIGGLSVDIPTGYFNHGNPCPPGCGTGGI